MARPNPGGEFEQAVLRSIPESPLIWVHKDRTPTRPAPVQALVEEVEKLCVNARSAAGDIGGALHEAAKATGLLPGDPAPPWAQRLTSTYNCLLALGKVPDWVTLARKMASTFTPPAGVDVMITATPKHHEQLFLEAPPLIVFSLELKSESTGRIRFDRVNPDQQKNLERAAAAGHVAGVLVEYRQGHPSECYFVPVHHWRPYPQTPKQASMPITQARELGIQIERDTERGRSRPYWKMAEFLRRFGAEV